VAFPVTGTKVFTVQVIYSVRSLAGDYVLPLTAAEANFPQALDMNVFVKLAPGVSASAGRSAIEKVLSSYPNATLMDQTQYKAQAEQSVNTLLNLVYALLALAVVIALIGIANTLALSIDERTRELGLLRAVGTTRGSCARSCARRSGRRPGRRRRAQPGPRPGPVDRPRRPSARRTRNCAPRSSPRSAACGPTPVTSGC